MSAPVEDAGVAGMIEIRIDGEPFRVRSGASVLAAALEAGVYVPHLCFHPALGEAALPAAAEAVYRGGERVDTDAGSAGAAFEGCGLCVVEVAGRGEPQRACELAASPGLEVTTRSPALEALRRDRLASMLARHPHACLTCAQREGCSREPCSSGVPVAERCCPLLGRCELEKLATYLGVPPHTPRYTPRSLAADRRDPLITWEPELCVGCLRCVRACGELKGVGALGFVVREGDIVVGLTAPERAEAGCRWCGACVEVCPTGALLDRPGATAPCRSACPAGMDVPRLLRAVADGRSEEAARVVMDRLPLPETLGRVCFHPCEADCRRAALGGALSVCRVRRSAFEALETPPAPWPAAGSGGRDVAVVGAGPAGLAAAHFLTRMGHRVTVLDAASEAGGMLRWGIPAYRLPREVLRRDLERLTAQGIELRLGVALGPGLTIEDLRRQGFEAVVLAAGAGRAKPLGLAGEELDGVLPGVDFLRAAAAGRAPEGDVLGRHVVVIGGGNVAVDAARTARRLGAASVTMACLEERGAMPAHPDEIAAAEAEGVAVVDGWGPSALVERDGAVAGVRLIRCTAVFDGAGRFAPRFDEAQIRELGAEAVIVAIGQQVDAGLRAAAAPDLTFGGSGVLQADVQATATGVPGVFACGDLSMGPSSVVRAIASGRRAAEAADRYLGGSGEVPSILEPERPSQQLGAEQGFAARRRTVAASEAPAERAFDFREVERGLSWAQAQDEAGRCLRCDLRELLAPAVLPPRLRLRLEKGALDAVPESAGVYQLIGEDGIAQRIVGTPSLRRALEDELGGPSCPPYFLFEAEPMYTKRESELIQQFLAAHGRMPGGGADDLDDLF